jgi:hypothetical protein
MPMSVKVSKDQACRRPLGEGWSNNFVVPPRLGVHDVSQYSCQAHVPQHEPLCLALDNLMPTGNEKNNTLQYGDIIDTVIRHGYKILSPTYKCGLHNPSRMCHNQLPIQFLQLAATAKTVRFEHHMLSSHCRAI